MTARENSGRIILYPVILMKLTDQEDFAFLKAHIHGQYNKNM